MHYSGDEEFFMGADMTGINGYRADFSEKDFSMRGNGSNGEQVRILFNSYCPNRPRHAILEYAYLVQTNFRKADLRRVSFKGSILHEAKFGQSDLRRADLSQAHFLETARGLCRATVNRRTLFPEDFDLNDHCSRRRP